MLDGLESHAGDVHRRPGVQQGGIEVADILDGDVGEGLQAADASAVSARSQRMIVRPRPTSAHHASQGLVSPVVAVWGCI